MLNQPAADLKSPTESRSPRFGIKPTKFDRQAAEADPLIAIAGGGGVNLFNSQGNPWTADYLKITGELDVDLRSNIAAKNSDQLLNQVGRSLMSVAKKRAAIEKAE